MLLKHTLVEIMNTSITPSYIDRIHFVHTNSLFTKKKKQLHILNIRFGKNYLEQENNEKSH